MDAKVVEEENMKLDIEREDILEEGSVVRIQNRVLGRRKQEHYWGDELWKVEGIVKRTSAYKIICGDNTRVENRENLKLVVGNVCKLHNHIPIRLVESLQRFQQSDLLLELPLHT